MHRFLLLSLLAFLCLAAAARADLEIESARYGTETIFRDVRGVLEAYVRDGTLSFPVSPRSMGGDPNPRETDFLTIVYRANGREFSETVADGKVFTFQGLPGVAPARPRLGLSFLPPPTPVTSPVLAVNRSGANARLYCVDRSGRWVWGADIGDTQTLSLTGQIGQEWIATDAMGQVLVRQRISQRENQLWIHPPGQRAPPGGFRGEEAWVRFENASFRTIYLYNLDSLGRWNWIATIEPNGNFPASTHIGETWIATDTANHIVRQTNVGPGMSSVKLY